MLCGMRNIKASRSVDPTYFTSNWLQRARTLGRQPRFFCRVSCAPVFDPAPRNSRSSGLREYHHSLTWSTRYGYSRAVTRGGRGGIVDIVRKASICPRIRICGRVKAVVPSQSPLREINSSMKTILGRSRICKLPF